MNAHDPKSLLRQMLRIRRVEEAIAEQYPKGEMKCPVHLSIGQEAVAVGVASALGTKDTLFSNHRCHAHYLAKGGNLPAMIAELMGRATGCALGRGGSMHLLDASVGLLGASALVGGTLPLATGNALTFQMGGNRKVTSVFFGDGASEEGVFYECLNFAALRKLPLLFVCENNGYATYSPIANRQANPNIADRVSRFGLPTETLDGNDVVAVHEAAQSAVERARAGEGPTLLECVTYRLRDHVGPGTDEQLGYRGAEEIELWKRERCPLERLRADLELESGEWAQWEAEIADEIADAFSFARQSPFPDAVSLGEGTYA